MVVYCEHKGKFYKVDTKTKNIEEVSKKEFLEKEKNKKSKQLIQKKPKPGDKVWIKIKPYKGLEEYGVVKDVLTNKKIHPRGHKVRLESGTIGRIKLD